MNVAFIYQKDDEILVVGFGENVNMQGYKHIATVNTTIYLQRIIDICKEDYTSDEKVNEILEMFK